MESLVKWVEIYECIRCKSGFAASVVHYGALLRHYCRPGAHQPLG
jgi:hypothetical protein